MANGGLRPHSQLGQELIRSERRPNLPQVASKVQTGEMEVQSLESEPTTYSSCPIPCEVRVSDLSVSELSFLIQETQNGVFLLCCIISSVCD